MVSIVKLELTTITNGFVSRDMPCCVTVFGASCDATMSAINNDNQYLQKKTVKLNTHAKRI